MDSSALRALAALPPEVPATLAVVVAVQGSAYRRPGAARLLSPGRAPAGLVGGGCLEADLDLREAPPVGPGRLLRYALGDGEQPWGLPAGCGGTVEIWLQSIPAGEDSPYRAAARWLQEGVAVTVTTLLRSGRQWAEAADGRICGTPAAEGGEPAFVDRRQPSPTFLVYGRGPDTAPMLQVAGLAGFQVRRAGRATELDGLLAAGRPDAAVVMDHHLAADRQALQALLSAGAPYVGVLGSRERTRRLLPEPWPPAVHAPVGLDIGAEAPEEIALAAVAEALAVLRGRGAGHLRDRTGPIHPRRPEARR